MKYDLCLVCESAPRFDACGVLIFWALAEKDWCGLTTGKYGTEKVNPSLDNSMLIFRYTWASSKQGRIIMC